MQQYRISREDQRLQHASAQQRDGHRYSGRLASFFTGQTCVAPDGHILAVKITEVTGPAGGDAIAVFDRTEMKGRHDQQVYEKSESGFFMSPAGDGVEVCTRGIWGWIGVEFPDWRTIIPGENLPDAQVISIDAEVLYRLAKALTPKGEKLFVTIEFNPGNLLAVVAPVSTRTGPA